MNAEWENGKWLSNPPPGEEVVITGMSGRLPDSNNIHEFQNNLFNKIDMVNGDYRRWKLDHPEVPQRTAKIYGIDKIDAGFFGLHYRQADIMEPMMRKFQETAIEAIMDAGLNPSELEGTKTGVFIGACYFDMESEILGNITEPQKLGVTGIYRTFIANRLSYYLKLKGPSFISDSACSSSFNALETAFKAIRHGKCDNAIVGGVNLLIHPGITRQFHRLGVLSPEGVCKPFDQNANGYVRGETIACVLLQKSKTAKRIYAQIIHSKVNDDGFKQFGITFPSAEMQEALMSEVLRESGIKPSDIDFLEAHGTGTEVGDPQEVKAIDCAFGKKRNKPLLVGSVKGNIGHTEPASGICSLIKVLIAMETGYIPPNINLKNIKKELEGFEQKRMIAVTETTKLENENAIIGINNFGFGGNNVHVIVKRFNKSKKDSLPNDLPRLICVSGRTEEAVSVLLEDAKRRTFDTEYFGLLHQVFKKNVGNHLYRGYAILTENGSITSHVECCPPLKTVPLYIFFGDFDQGCRIMDEFLMQFAVFREIKHKNYNELLKPLINNKILESRHDFLTPVIVQIGFLEMLKLVNIEPTAVYGESIGKIASRYYYGDINIEKTIEVICKHAEKYKNIDRVHPEKEKLAKTRDATFDEIVMKGDGVFLNVSDEFKDAKNELKITENGNLQFLEILGRLYLEGYTPHLHKIYPEVEFPVSRATPMISPSIKWDYRKSWHTYKFGDENNGETYYEECNVSVALYEEQKYLAGHIIDGRNLIPATEYLNLVWRNFTRNIKFMDSTPIIFENCRFIRAVTIPKTEAIKISVSIHRGSGYFEVCEKDSLIVSGRIYSPEDVDQHQTDLPMIDFDTNDHTEILEKNDIYRELSLRGYNYSGLFKGIGKCNVDASVGLVEWEGNYTTFIDKMLQLKILQMDTRLLYVPVGIQKIVIDPTNHSLSANAHKSLCPVYNYKNYNIVKCDGIEIHGIKARSIARRKLTSEPVLEKNIFVPNNAKLSLEESVRVITQIILENSLENVFKAVEIVDKFTEIDSGYVLPIIHKSLSDIPLITPALTISTKTPPEEEVPEINIENVVLTPTSNFLLIVASKILQRTSFLNQILSSVEQNGYILTREDVNFIPEFNNCVIISEYLAGKEKLILFKKLPIKKKMEFIEISSEELEWIPKLQNSLKSDNDIVAYSQSQEPVGLLGLINCIRREPEGKKVSCFFLDNDAPKFNPEDEFYSNQIEKKVAFNIYKDGKWGTYKHLPLQEANDIENRHVFVNTRVRGDISSLRWFQGWLTSKTKLEHQKILVYPFYSAVNFKDIMAASGRVNIEALSTERLSQESLLGFEFCGIDARGRRVLGMISDTALATMVIGDETFLWEIPEEWSLEDAGTVTVVYVTVLYALFVVIKLKPGMSILIHSATGGIGLAALNVCLYHGCDVYVTVGTDEKRKYLHQHYPQIPDSHIGNSRSTSFEEMIKRETKGRGVDVVLNSLSEEKLRASVRCLAKGGNFIEIGKYDMGVDSPLNLLLMENNINYHGVMLDRIFLQSIEIKTWLVDAVYQGINLGYVKPLPRKVFEKDQIEEAFRYMMTGKHIGKILIKIQNEDEKLPVFKGIPRFHCDSEKSYIIIGGLGGFGLELADWLFLRRVKKLILVSRSGIQSGYQKQRIKIWESNGVTVEISTQDITTLQGCINLIKEASNLGPIDAIFNLAVVLKDEIFENQSQETFEAVLGPKAKATSFLDQVTRTFCPNLRYFVVFSSVSCGRGNVGQSNYGMANSVMERICERRKNDGFPGLAIQWGAIGDVGLVAKMQKENKELIIGGTLQQKVSSCLEVLDKFLHQTSPIVSSMVVAEKNTKNYSFESAVNAVTYVLGIKDIKVVGYHTSFAELGMDSMMGNELAQILETDFEIYVTAKDVRKLTFAKLLELENQQKEVSQQDHKAKLNINLLVRCIPSGDVDLAPVVQFSSRVNNDEKAPKVFVLPGIEGVYEFLEPLTKGLHAHVYGINYKFYNLEDSIEEISRNILPDIEKRVTKSEVFSIIGYSFGTVVATELVALLEKDGYVCRFIAIDGSVPYLQQSIRKVFPATSENEFETVVLLYILSLVLPTYLINDKKNEFLKCQSFNDRIEFAESLVPPDLLQKGSLDKQGVMVLYKRLKHVVNYNFGHEKLKSPIHLFKAKHPVVEEFDEDYKLSEICTNIVEVTLVDGDHNSVINQPQLVEAVDRILNNV